MKKLIKVFSAILSTALLLSVTACSSGTGSASSASSAASSEAASSEAASSEATSSTATGEKAQLKICTISLACIQDMETNEFTKYMEEKTNTHVTWSFVPSTNTNEKLQVILNSGSLPDVFMFGNEYSFTAADLAKYGVDQGLFVALDDYIEKDAPNLKEALAKSDMPDALNTLRLTDGHVYAMPILDTCQHCEHSAKMWVYQPWLDKLGIKTPTTTDEFEAMLQAFKTKDPNGNGKADEIPFVGCAYTNGGGWQDEIELYLMNSFCYYDRSNEGFYVKDGKISNSLSEDGYKAGLQYLNKLWSEGLIYSNSMTQDNQSLVKLVENTNAVTVGAVPGGFTGMFASLGGERARGFRPIAPLKGPSGLQQSPTFPSYPANGAYVITSDCKNIDAAVKYADFMYTDEVTLDIRCGLGLKGVGWEDAKQGAKDFDGNQAVYTPLKTWNDKDPQNVSWLELGVWNYTKLRAQSSVDSNVDLWSAEGLEYMLYKETKELYKPYEVNQALPPLSLNADDADKVAQAKTNLEKYIDSTQYAFISGKTKFDDASWSKYLSDLKPMVDALTAIYQKAYDTAYKK